MSEKKRNILYIRIRGSIVLVAGQRRKLKLRKRGKIMMKRWVARAGRHTTLSGGLHHNTGQEVNERGPTHVHTHMQ